LRFRYVVDFVQVHWYDSWSFAIFNVADACITVGAIFLILSELLNYWKARK
jgi:signal peptidase II